MDLATVLGMFTAFGMVAGAMIMTGSPLAYLDLHAVVIVFGGTVGATLLNYPMDNVLGVFRTARKALVTHQENPSEIIVQFIDFATRARREGILSLEPMIGASGDDYMRKGLQLAVDGMEPGAIREILETEIHTLEARHQLGADILTSMGGFAPAMGLIGTVMGLVGMLRQMDDPSKIGPAMAVAMLATFYGVTLANLIFLPLAGKLRTRSREEVHVRELMLEGVLALSKGENPRVVLEKLNSFLPPVERRADV